MSRSARQRPCHAQEHPTSTPYDVLSDGGRGVVIPACYASSRHATYSSSSSRAWTLPAQAMAATPCRGVAWPLWDASRRPSTPLLGICKAVLQHRAGGKPRRAPPACHLSANLAAHPPARLPACRCKKLLKTRMWPHAETNKPWDGDVRLQLHACMTLSALAALKRKHPPVPHAARAYEI